MWARLSILAGLLAGVAAAVLVIGGILAFAPEPGAAATPPPPPSASPSVVPEPTASPSTVPTASPSTVSTASPSTAPSQSPSASATAGGSGSPVASATGTAFHVGEPDPALGGIGPGVMEAGLRTILPGVQVGS
jgi:hypothetical protein